MKKIHELICKMKLNEKQGKIYAGLGRKYYEREEGCRYNLKFLIKKKLAKGKLIAEICGYTERKRGFD